MDEGEVHEGDEVVDEGEVGEVEVERGRLDT